MVCFGFWNSSIIPLTETPIQLGSHDKLHCGRAIMLVHSQLVCLLPVGILNLLLGSGQLCMYVCMYVCTERTKRRHTGLGECFSGGKVVRGDARRLYEVTELECRGIPVTAGDSCSRVTAFALSLLTCLGIYIRLNAY